MTFLRLSCVVGAPLDGDVSSNRPRPLARSSLASHALDQPLVYLLSQAESRSVDLDSSRLGHDQSGSNRRNSQHFVAVPSYFSLFTSLRHERPHPLQFDQRDASPPLGVCLLR